jgi:hypothetical protein
LTTKAALTTSGVAENISQGGFSSLWSDEYGRDEEVPLDYPEGGVDVRYPLETICLLEQFEQRKGPFSQFGDEASKPRHAPYEPLDNLDVSRYSHLFDGSDLVWVDLNSSV